MDNVDAVEAAAEIRRYLTEGDTGVSQTVPYEGHDRVVTVEPGLLVQVPFGPRPRPLRFGEAWETVIRLRDADAEVVELVLEHSEHASPNTKMYLRHRRRYYSLRAPNSENDVWSSEQLGAILPELSGRHVTLSLEAEGANVAHVDDRHTLEIERVGIRPIYSSTFPPAPSHSDTAHSDAAHSDIAHSDISDIAHLDTTCSGTPMPSTRREGVDPSPGRTSETARRREHLARILHELTELHIWDYTWLEAPPPERMGSKAVLTLAGSTDLTYYHLVRVYFRGVRYHTIPRHFSHPFLALASPAEEAQLRDLAAFGRGSFAVRLLTEFGGRLQRGAYVVADWIEVQRLEGDEETTAYRPIHPANVGWW